jgi:hypothetical protein
MMGTRRQVEAERTYRVSDQPVTELATLAQRLIQLTGEGKIAWQPTGDDGFTYVGLRATVVIRSQDSGQRHPFILTLLDGDVEVDSLRLDGKKLTMTPARRIHGMKIADPLPRRTSARNIGALIESLIADAEKAASRSYLAPGPRTPELGWHARWPAQPATHASATRRHPKELPRRLQRLAHGAGVTVDGSAALRRLRTTCSRGRGAPSRRRHSGDGGRGGDNGAGRLSYRAW